MTVATNVSALRLVTVGQNEGGDEVADDEIALIDEAEDAEELIGHFVVRLVPVVGLAPGKQHDVGGHGVPDERQTGPTASRGGHHQPEDGVEVRGDKEELRHQPAHDAPLDAECLHQHGAQQAAQDVESEHDGQRDEAHRAVLVQAALQVACGVVGHEEDGDEQRHEEHVPHVPATGHAG